MSFFSDNIKSLRIRRKLTQEKLAQGINITRARYSKYEDGRSEAPYSILCKLSQYFNVSIDVLLTADISKVEIEGLMKLENNRVLLPIKTDINGENLIEVVPHKARMGYMSGYSDPEYIDSLPTISLPFLKNGKFRAFAGSGDSMPPHNDTSYIIGKYLETVDEVRDGKTYILVTKDDGIVYKRLKRSSNISFTASSDNFSYTPYDVKFSEILEVWEFVCSIETTAFEPEDLNLETVKEMFQEIKREIRTISSKIYLKDFR